jgi:DNA-directed RNA polymerase subunit RPC12/RpoP
MDLRENAVTVVYICWDCGGDFKVSEHDGLTDSLVVMCPVCGSDLVAVDFAAVRRRRPDTACAGVASHAYSRV